MIKTRRVGWFINLACISKVKNINIIFVGKYEGMKQFVRSRCGYHIGRLFPVYAMKTYEEQR
jgi:hypothetical protein